MIQMTGSTQLVEGSNLSSGIPEQAKYPSLDTEPVEAKIRRILLEKIHSNGGSGDFPNQKMAL